ncbi:30S ribosomal protein S17 [Candidatus Micrarchaeota archaeon]|nr:30S ribosomal protein S17 [Candidatus Micrarchaeota archaeon]MBD3418277.1 30S ribosomal protein S17 [Candidatus Micrarchaeota archaeon]
MAEAKGNKQKRPISSRGARIVGRVVSDKNKKTVVVERDLMKKISKYKRMARERSRVQAHNPDEIEAKVGDIVRIGETRKISKTKSWIVLEVISKAEEVGA